MYERVLRTVYEVLYSSPPGFRISRCCRTSTVMDRRVHTITWNIFVAGTAS